MSLPTLAEQSRRHRRSYHTCTRTQNRGISTGFQTEKPHGSTKHPRIQRVQPLHPRRRGRPGLQPGKRRPGRHHPRHRQLQARRQGRHEVGRQRHPGHGQARDLRCRRGGDGSAAHRPQGLAEQPERRIRRGGREELSAGADQPGHRHAVRDRPMQAKAAYDRIKWLGCGK